MSAFETEALMNKLAACCDAADEAGIRAALINSSPVGYAPRLPGDTADLVTPDGAQTGRKKSRMIAAE